MFYRSCLYTMASSSTDPLPLPIKLSSTNYLYWKNQMTPVLTYQNLFHHVDGTETTPPNLIKQGDKQVSNPEFLAWLAAEQRTIIILNASLTEESISVIVGLSTAREIWSALEAAHSNSLVEGIQNSKDQLRFTQKGKTMAEFGHSFKFLCDQPCAIGHPIDAANQLHWFLCGLRPSFESFSTSSVKCIISILLLVIISCTECFEISKGINGLEKVILRQTHGSSAEVYLYGAHVTSWKNEQGDELLFLSREAIFQPPKPIRGGIPLCFPQFSNFGPLQSHGFARNRFWTIDTPAFPHNVTNSGFVDLLLKPTEEDLKLWPNSFEYRLRVTLGGRGNLMMTSRIKNTNSDGKPFNFTFAYHNYFLVSNISEVQVKGLQKLDYLDNLQNRERFTDQGDAITIQSEFDKIYLSTPKKVEVLDHGKKRTLTIHKDGLPDSVVWNPWEERAKTMVDLGDEEYKNMVAVESAAIEKPITLKAGQEWKVTQELSAVPSRKSS